MATTTTTTTSPVNGKGAVGNGHGDQHDQHDDLPGECTRPLVGANYFIVFSPFLALFVHTFAHTRHKTDQVMMTPLKKEIDSTILRVERLPPTETAAGGGGGGGDRHVAGGQHQGIIINKQLASLESARGPCDLRLSFKVFLVNSITQLHQQELRELRFWFDRVHNGSPAKLTNGNSEAYVARMHCAQAFFRELVNANDFPKSYVFFITKLMKTMQLRVYRPLVQIELEVRPIDEPFKRPSSATDSSKYPLVDPPIDPGRGNVAPLKRAISDVRPQPAPRKKCPPPPIAPKPRHLWGEAANVCHRPPPPPSASSARSMSLDGETEFDYLPKLACLLAAVFPSLPSFSFNYHKLPKCVSSDCVSKFGFQLSSPPLCIDCKNKREGGN